MRKIAVAAGEISSDNYGRRLIKELKKSLEPCRKYAVGGDGMEREADTCIANITQRAVVGFTEALKEIPYLLRLKKNIEKKYFKSSSPHRIDALILIDYPGFNIKLARSAARHGVRVYYYITPQVWAWGRGRIKVLSRLCRRLFCVFRFEEKLFKEAGGNAEFVGHPLLDEMPPPGTVKEFEKKMSISEYEKIIALLPGSRKREVEKILPPAARALKPFKARVIVGLAPSLTEKDIRRFMDYGEITRDTPALLLRADGAVVSSGTSNLEAAIAGTPFISVYKVSPLSYLLARMLVKVDYVSMVNILASEKVVEELIQGELNPENIRRHMKEIMKDKEKRRKMRAALKKVAGSLGSPGAAARVAEAVGEDLK